MEFLNPEFLAFIPILFLFINKKNFLYVFSGVFVLLAMSGLAKVTQKEIKIPNNDVYIAIDNSWSMACEDLKANRLEAAKKAVAKFIKDTNYSISLLTFNKNIDMLVFPTQSKLLLLEKLKNIKLQKSSTDIEMVVNAINNINSQPKTIIIVSDGGDKKIEGNFIFWGFATKKGSKVPGYDGISKLNIIGKYFNDEKKIIQYINSHFHYKIKQVPIYKYYSKYFVLLALFMLFLNGLKMRFFVIFLAVLPHQSYALDSLGCLYQMFGFEKLAIKEYKDTNSDFSNMKIGIYYMKHKKYKKAITYFQKVQKYQKEKSYNIALCLIELGKYDKAYEIMQSLKKYDDKKIQNLYKGLYEYFKDLTIVYPIYNPSKENKQKQTKKNNSNSKSLLKKDNQW